MPLNRLIDSGSPIQPPPDVQRTSLGLDVVSRFICSTWDEAVGNGGSTFDAVVIGAGTPAAPGRKSFITFGDFSQLGFLALEVRA